MLLTLILLLSIATPSATPSATPTPEPIVLDPGQVAITITAVEIGDPADVLEHPDASNADGDTAIVVSMTVEYLGTDKMQTGDLGTLVVSDGNEYKLWKASSCGGNDSFISSTHIRPGGSMDVQACFVVEGDGKDAVLEVRHATEGGEVTEIELADYMP